MSQFFRDRLEAYTTPLSATVSPPRLPPPASLTSDLLHVEEQLQSRVRMLEGEKRQASLQALQLEKALASQKKQFHAAMETLRGEHEVAMCKVGSRCCNAESAKWARNAESANDVSFTLKVV